MMSAEGHQTYCRAVVKEVQGMYPDSVLLAAGWSLGGGAIHIILTPSATVST